MTKQQLLDSRENIPPIAYRTKRPTGESSKVESSELTRLAIESKREEMMIDKYFSDYE